MENRTPRRKMSLKIASTLNIICHHVWQVDAQLTVSASADISLTFHHAGQQLKFDLGGPLTFHGVRSQQVKNQLNRMKFSST